MCDVGDIKTTVFIWEGICSKHKSEDLPLTIWKSLPRVEVEKERTLLSTKMKQIAVAVVAIAVVLVGTFAYRELRQDNNQKEITITIIQGDDELFNQVVTTNAGTLADLLKEMKADGSIQLEYTTSAFGMYIIGMGVDTLYSEEPANNIYWVYSSPNNKQCVSDGYCDAVDALAIRNHDIFIFELHELNP